MFTVQSEIVSSREVVIKCLGRVLPVLSLDSDKLERCLENLRGVYGKTD